LLIQVALRPKKDVIRFGYVTDVAYRRGTRIVTTCLMEPGDSGGPVFDLLGRVVGLHSAIDGPLDRNYEIPVDLYRKYWTALQKPQAYTELPSEEVIPADPLLTSKQAFIDYKNVEPAFPKLETRFEKSSLKITSKADTVTFSIIGTSINLKGIVDAKILAGRSFLVSKNSMVGQNPMVHLGNGKPQSPKSLLAMCEKI
jgi:serine protease Do